MKRCWDRTIPMVALKWTRGQKRHYSDAMCSREIAIPRGLDIPNYHAQLPSTKKGRHWSYSRSWWKSRAQLVRYCKKWNHERENGGESKHEMVRLLVLGALLHFITPRHGSHFYRYVNYFMMYPGTIMQQVVDCLNSISIGTNKGFYMVNTKRISYLV